MGRVFPQMEQTRPRIPLAPCICAYDHGIWGFKNLGHVPHILAERLRA